MSPTSYQLLHPAISYQIIILQYWCRRPGSNRYGYHYPQDFKSWASANSATPAGKKLAPRVGLEPTAYRLTAGCSTIELPRITSFIISTTSMIIDYVMLFCQYIFYNFYRLESFFCDLNSESKFYSAILLQYRSISPLYINLFIVIHIQMISGIYIFILVIYASKPFWWPCIVIQ